MLKCSHTFNLLDARGAISVTERAAYIGRVRNLARDVAKLYVEQTPMPDLLFEIGCEELPALGLPRGRGAAPADWRAEHLGREPSRVLVGPRRLAILVEDLPDVDRRPSG